MQSTGQGSRHLPQPEHSSGTMMTSIPWLKMAPNWGGQWRRHVSQLMHSAISIRSGACFHFGLRARTAMRSSRERGATAPEARVTSARNHPSQPNSTNKESDMAKHPFLSDEWVEAARGIYEAHRGEGPKLPVTLRANLNITDVPFGAGSVQAHLDSSSGELEFEIG